MKTAIVNFKELAGKNNPILCLSAKRHTENCVNCTTFIRAQSKTIKVKKTQEELDQEGGVYIDPYKFITERLTIEKTLKRIKCKPIVTKEQIDLLKERERLFEESKELMKSRDQINKTLGLK